MSRWDRQIDDLAALGDALSVKDIKLRHAEGGGDLVLHDLDLDPVAVAFGAGLEHLGAAYVKSDRSVKLQRPSAVVVSGFPYMVPTFSRSWFMKMTMQFVFDTIPESLRSACDIRRA